MKQRFYYKCLCKKSMEIDSFVDVFIYTDSEDRLVANNIKTLCLFIWICFIGDSWYG